MKFFRHKSLESHGWYQCIFFELWSIEELMSYRMVWKPFSVDAAIMRLFSHCIVFYCILLYFILLYCILFYFIVLHYILLYCIVSNLIVLYSTTSFYIEFNCIVFYSTALHCNDKGTALISPPESRIDATLLLPSGLQRHVRVRSGCHATGQRHRLGHQASLASTTVGCN